MADEQNKQITFHEHPDFTLNRPKWRQYRDLYDGDHRTLTQPEYLWPHELESSTQPAKTDPSSGAVLQTVGEKLRGLRALRSRYLNLFEPAVSTFVSLAFPEAPKPDKQVEDMLGEEINDIDGEGNSLENFIKSKLAVAYFRDGRPHVLADAPGAPDGEFKSKGEEQQAGFRPFLELLDVLEVADWQPKKAGSQRGQYDWLRHEYRAIPDRADPGEEPKELQYTRVLTAASGQYRQLIYRREENAWIRDGEILVPKWDVVPVASVMGNAAWVKDLAPLQLSLFNTMSGFLNLLHTQIFQRVLISGSVKEQHQIAISEYAWSVLPEGATITVVDQASVSQHVDAMAWLANQFYRVAFNRARGLSDSSKEAPGAETIKEMNAELLSLLRVALTEMEDVTNRSLAFYARFKGEKNFRGRVTFEKDLKEEDIERQSELFLAYRDEIRKLLSWRKAHLKKVVRQEEFTDEEYQKIEKEIDALKAEPEVNPLAGFGPFVGNDGGRGEQDQGAVGTAGGPGDNKPGGASRPAGVKPGAVPS